MNELTSHEHILTKYQGKQRKVVVPEGIQEIGEFAFYNCDFIEEIILPNNLTSIGSFAFYGCENLKTLEIPDSVEMIDKGAFSYCYQLESIKLPSQLRTIAKSLFYQCKNLQQIELPSTIQTIHHSAFSFCLALQHIKLPPQIQEIPDNAFANCVSLKEIVLPDSIIQVGYKAFYHCPKLALIQVSANLENVLESAFETEGPCCFSGNENMLVSAKMFDANWHLSLNRHDPTHYLFHDSYFPKVDLPQWKPQAQLILMANFLETYARHKENSKAYYIHAIKEKASDLLAYLVYHQRYAALNQAIEVNLYTSKDIEPYFEQIKDREEKAKLMAYSQANQDSSVDDLENMLEDLF